MPELVKRPGRHEPCAGLLPRHLALDNLTVHAVKVVGLETQTLLSLVSTLKSPRPASLINTELVGGLRYSVTREFIKWS